MTLSDFIAKLNWRLMVVHLVACWFFIYAFMELFVLHDFKYFMEVSHHPRSGAVDYHRFWNDVKWENFSYCAGLLVAFLISLGLCIKKRWYWVNSLAAFLTAYFLWRFDLSGWRFLRPVLLFPGEFFSYTTVWYFLVNGSLLLAIGLLLFFLRPIVKFIDWNSQNFAITALESGEAKFPDLNS